MANLNIVALYLGLNAFVLLGLFVNVVRFRAAQKQIAPGSMGDERLTAAIRAHANYTENAPAVLLMLAVLAALGSTPLFLHVYGAVFTVARVLQAVGMMSPKQPNLPRMVGTMATVMVLVVGGVASILAFF